MASGGQESAQIFMGGEHFRGVGVGGLNIPCMERDIYEGYTLNICFYISRDVVEAPNATYYEQ